MAWWVDAPGVYVFMPRGGQLLANDCRKVADMFSFANLERRFPGNGKLYFLFNFINGNNYESEARVAMTNWGREISKERFGEALVELSDDTPALVRMGVSSAAAALAIVGRKVSVVTLTGHPIASRVAVIPSLR